MATYRGVSIFDFCEHIYSKLWHNQKLTAVILREGVGTIYYVLSTLDNRKLPDYVLNNIRIYFYFAESVRTFVENI